MRRLGGLVYGPVNCVLIIIMFAFKHYFLLQDDLALAILRGLFLGEALLLGLIPFLVGGKSPAPRWKNPWFLAPTLLLAASLFLALTKSLMGWEPLWNPEPGIAASVYALLIAGFGIVRYVIRMTGKLNPALVLPASFIATIVIGALLLMHPRATPPDRSISPTDAFFTSTSATCVTGLIVLDTETDFTRFGQLIILILIQVGGLGIMTFAAFFALSLGQNMSLRDAFSLSRMMDSDFISDLKSIVTSIVVWTLIIETAGAFLLASVWRDMMPGWTTGMLVWQAVFHSVSAFCNAGFSLNSANLEGFSASPATPLIIGILIVLGGMGFGVLTTVANRWVQFIRTGRKTRLPVQARFVCLVTAILIALAFGVFLSSEWNNSLAGMSLGEKLANSFLGAVTPRTAGFNTVPTASLMPHVKWFFVLMMFIGASPGGTGGGVKTTSLGLMFLSTKSLLTSRLNPEVWKRRIPNFDLRRAGAIFTIGFLTFAISSTLLMVSEGSRGDSFETIDYAFEAMSAFGTVGLSTGVTPTLTTLGRWIVIITMFIGRTAPATLAAATFRVTTSRYLYPEARITIG